MKIRKRHLRILVLSAFLGFQAHSAREKTLSSSCAFELVPGAREEAGPWADYINTEVGSVVEFATNIAGANGLPAFQSQSRKLISVGPFQGKKAVFSQETLTVSADGESRSSMAYNCYENGRLLSWVTRDGLVGRWVESDPGPGEGVTWQLDWDGTLKSNNEWTYIGDFVGTSELRYSKVWKRSFKPPTLGPSLDTSEMDFFFAPKLGLIEYQIHASDRAQKPSFFIAYRVK